MKFLIVILTVSLLLAGCQWVTLPPELDDEVFWQGAMSGCIRTHMHAIQSPTEEDKELATVYCYFIADEALRIRNEMRADGIELPPIPQSVPVRERAPGSLL